MTLKTIHGPKDQDSKCEVEENVDIDIDMRIVGAKNRSPLASTGIGRTESKGKSGICGL